MPLPEIVQLAARRVGNVRRLALALGIDPSAPYYWTGIPRRHARRIHELTGIPLRELCPDIFPEEGSDG